MYAGVMIAIGQTHNSQGLQEQRRDSYFTVTPASGSHGILTVRTKKPIVCDHRMMHVVAHAQDRMARE
jgi:hypothetical protein